MTRDLVEIPGGTFLMGDAGGEFDEAPEHEVELAGFLLARAPVTNREYSVYLEEGCAVAPRFWHDARFNQPDQPVVGVSWFEAVAYCEWLATVTGAPRRLPTEAEHEWAALGGLGRVRYPWGDDEPALVGSWAPGARGQDRPLPISQGRPNGFGLLHICDNVHEWCSDWWDPTYYAVAPRHNPSGPASGTRRASRGGAWRHYLKFSRCAARSSLDPSFRYNDYGFRVAADLR